MQYINLPVNTFFTVNWPSLLPYTKRPLYDIPLSFNISPKPCNINFVPILTNDPVYMLPV